MANMASVKLQILLAMQAYFAAMQADQPTADPFGITWSTVALGPLAAFDQRKKFSLGVASGKDIVVEYKYPAVYSKLTVNMEIRVTVNRDDDPPGVAIEEAITVVKRGLVADRTWGGLALDTKVTEDEADLVTYADRSAVAVVVVEILYRYSYTDPRSTKPAL